MYGLTDEVEKLDELKVTVGIHDVSVVCVSETWFKDYMGKDSLNLYGFNLERTQLAKYMGPIWVADVSKWAGHVGPTWATQITPTVYV